MNKPDTDKAWDILIQRNAKRAESRTAFLAALIADRCRTLVPEYNREAGGDATTTIAPHMAEAFAVEFVRLARRLKRHAENECNREVTAREERDNQRDADRFHALAEALGFVASAGGDPRGACAYLIDPDDRKGDGWGDGFAVYA